MTPMQMGHFQGNKLASLKATLVPNSSVAKKDKIRLRYVELRIESDTH